MFTEPFQENNSSISEMLKCVLDGNKGFIEALEKTNEYPNPWLPNGMGFDYCPPQLSGSSLSASIDKQEREIAYNVILYQHSFIDKFNFYNHHFMRHLYFKL